MRSKLGGKRMILGALLACLALGAFGEPKRLSSLDEIAAMARTNSLGYQKAVAAARSAELAIPAAIKLSSSTLVTSYTYDEAAPLKGGSVKLTLPIVDQVALSASVSGDLSGSLAATISPLAHSDTRNQALINYEKAQAAVQEAARAASETAVKAALTWMSASRALETRQEAVKVKEDTYQATKQANAIDPDSTTMDDLVTAFQELSTARAALVTAQGAERKAQGALYEALGATRDEVLISALDSDGLSADLDRLESAWADAASSGVDVSYDQKLASLEVRSDKSALDSIWAFEPELSISAGLSFASGGTATPKATITLSLSPDDLKKDERATAAASLDLAQKALAQQRRADQNSYDEAVAAVKAAKINSENCKLALDQAKEMVGVAAFNLSSGEGSALEKDSALLSQAEAEDALFKALADEYSAWLDLAALAGKS